MLSVYRHFEVDDREGTITETGASTSSTNPLIDSDLATEADPAARRGPDLPVYSDGLLLIDALVEAMGGVELSRTVIRVPPRRRVGAEGRVSSVRP